MNEQELAKMSGENTFKSPEKYIVPTIKLNGKDGGFFQTIINKDGKPEKIALGNEIKVIMLKVRRSYFHFTKSIKLYTNEHNSFKDKIIVFESRKNKDESWSKSQVVFEGDCKTVRTTFPELRMKQAIYCLFNGEVIKLFVKGKGLGNLFDYWQEFKGAEHIFQYNTKVGMVEETSPLGTYYATTFEKEDKLKDITEVAEKIKEVCDNLERVEEYYLANAPVAPEEIGKEKEKIKMEDIPIIEEADDEDEDPIDVKDIPF